QGELGDGIRPTIGICGKAGDGTHIEDMTALLPLHRIHYAPRYMICTVQVGVDHHLQIAIGLGAEFAGYEKAGIVYQYLYRPFERCDKAGKAQCLRLIRKICGMDMDIYLVFCFYIRLECLEVVYCSRARCDVKSCRREPEGDGPPYPPAGTGHRDEFAHEMVLFHFWVSLAR